MNSRTFVIVCALAAIGGVSSWGQAAPVQVPDWAQPGSATHKQVPPPADFHRPTLTENVATGVFDGVSEIGGPLVPGSSSFYESSGTYRVTSSGYNIWYSRDEFRFLWKRVTGDVSLAANVRFEKGEPRSDRKLVLVLRQTLEDDSKEAVVAEHGTGMVHLAERPERGAMTRDWEYTFGGELRNVMSQRIGIEKRGDQVQLFISIQGEPMRPYGPPITLHLDGPFYVGIGFCPHIADALDTGVFSDVVLQNRAGAVR